MKVLLAVDGSPYTKRMLAFLTANDDMLAGQNHYTVLTVVPKIPPHAARFLSSSDLQSYYDDEAEKVLGPVRSFLAQKSWEVDFRHELGQPADAICEAAQSGGFDLLALGSHGHSAIGNLVLGSVATRVLSQCKLPVLLIR
jgi:nucleotide-binding universal stress UspA family protein